MVYGSYDYRAAAEPALLFAEHPQVKLKLNSFKVIINSPSIMWAFPITCLCKHGKKRAEFHKINFTKEIKKKTSSPEKTTFLILCLITNIYFPWWLSRSVFSAA